MGRIPVRHEEAATAMEYIGGINPVLEALGSEDSRVQKIYLARGAHPRLASVQDAARRLGIPVVLRERRDLDRMAPDVVHQGVLALTAPAALEDISRFLARDAGRDATLLLVIDQIEDPHNLGALIRSAHVAGADGVLMTRRRTSPLTPAAVKASAGAVEHIPLIGVTNLVQALDRLKEEGFWVMGADDSAETNLFRVDFSVRTAVVIGNEGAGIRHLVKQSCDVLFRIPGKGRISSLNASAAGAVVLFEILRQRMDPRS